MAKPICYCEVDGCEKRVKGHGLCETHYMRMLRKDPQGLAKLRERPPADPSPCSVDDCDRPSSHRGLCNMHYLRLHRHGSLEKPTRKGRPPVPFRACSVDDCDRRAKSKGMCQIHYVRAWHKARYVPVPRRPAADRFWEKVDRRGPDECWEWQAAKINGYGSFMSRKSTGKFAGNSAHRIAYELLIGPIPKGAHLHHRCENRGCVNPAHLDVIQPTEHHALTMAQMLRSLGYTVIEPDAH